ncbi:Calcium/calmodulin-dependent 3',5'-cyclic nucleotide phosphodiesterase 1C [Cichlidogyrus casuarinus]|uniref:Calcium/calmodulin-dependent 3',5'-cyclic nucleotide phosphodiesterase 1C n=1 Tax=Cichlidogyrus casuarinus TaxID=1844966 RepID=A0ABD2PT82_9PLAT
MGLDSWGFDIFDMNEASDNHALKYIGYELLHKYDLINKFKVDANILDSLLIQLEIGYSRNRNPYHNLIHAADVAQTSHVLLQHSKLADWLTDLEVFATLFAAIIHDYDHTGTTNNFHIQTKSNLALTYNDRCVLENYHVSSVFKLTQDSMFNIFTNFSPEQYKEFRNYVIEIVINTDMSLHFGQIKKWDLHERWTNVLCEEFFRQGDREKQLSLPVSPLCDRNTVVVPQSQIGFIDFIVEPSFTVLGDMMQKILYPQVEPDKTDETAAAAAPEKAETKESNSDTDEEISSPKVVPRPWVEHFKCNKQNWSSEAEKLQKEKEQKEKEQKEKEQKEKEKESAAQNGQ